MYNFQSRSDLVLKENEIHCLKRERCQSVHFRGVITKFEWLSTLYLFSEDIHRHF